MTALDDFTDTYRYTLFVLGLGELDDVTIAFVDLDQGAFIEMPESIETAERLIYRIHGSEMLTLMIPDEAREPWLSSAATWLIREGGLHRWSLDTPATGHKTSDVP